MQSPWRFLYFIQNDEGVFWSYLDTCNGLQSQHNLLAHLLYQLLVFHLLLRVTCKIRQWETSKLVK